MDTQDNLAKAKAKLAAGLRGAEYRAALAEYEALKAEAHKVQPCAVCGKPVGYAKLGLLEKGGKLAGWCCSWACFSSPESNLLINGFRLKGSTWVQPNKHEE
jgi:hypothetical protein